MMAMEEELEEMGVPAEAGDEPSADRCTDAAGAGVRRVIDTPTAAIRGLYHIG